jgi:glycerol-3-phosphate acyltransferase PlsY
MSLELAVFWLACAALGGIHFALWVGYLLGVDLRTQGSRNCGATNLGRLAGKGWGVLAFVLDALKGAVPLLWAGHSLESVRAAGGDWPLVIGGSAAILGHCFSPFLLFRGGKGVATAFGVLAVLAPIWSLAVLAAVWLLVLAAVRVVGIASSSAAVVCVLLGCDQLFGFAARAIDASLNPDPALGLFLVGLGSLVLARHRRNIANYWVARRSATPR